MTVIDEGKVRILPDFEGFEAELRTKLAEVTRGVVGTVKVGVEVDSSGASKTLRTLSDNAARTTAKIKTDADVAGATAKLKDLTKDKAVNVKVNVAATGDKDPFGMAAMQARMFQDAASNAASLRDKFAFSAMRQKMFQDDARAVAKVRADMVKAEDAAYREDARRTAAHHAAVAKAEEAAHREDANRTVTHHAAIAKAEIDAYKEKEQRFLRAEARWREMNRLHGQALKEDEKRGGGDRTFLQRLSGYGDEDGASSTGVKKGLLARFFGSSQALTYGVGLGVATSAPLLGSAAALAGTFAAGTAAAVSFGAVATAQIAQVATAVQNFEAGESLTGQLAPFAGVVAKFEELKSAWYGLLGATRQPMFDLFNQAMNVAIGLMPRLVPLVNAFSGAMTTALGTINTPDAQAFINFISNAAPTAITSLTQVATNFGLGIANILTGFSGAQVPFLDKLGQMSSDFLTWTQSLASSNGFQTFVDYIATNGPKILDIVESLAITVGHVVEALAPLGASILNVAQGFAQWMSTLDPQTLLSVASGVLAILIPLKAFTIISNVARWFLDLGEGVEDLGKVMGIAALETNGLKFALLGFAAVTVVGAVIAGIVYALTNAASAQQKAAAAAREHQAAIQSLAQTIRDADDATLSSTFVTKLQAPDVKYQATTGKSSDSSNAAKIERSTSILNQAAAAGVGGETVLAGLKGDKTAYDQALAQWDQYITSLRYKVANAKTPEEQTAAQNELSAAKAGRKGFVDYAADVDKARASNEQFNSLVPKTTDVLNDQTGALNATVTAFQRYQNMIAQTPEEQVLSDVVSKYDAYTNAVHALAKAKQQQADTAFQSARANRDAERGVIDAERSLADAHRATERAQRDLTQARRDAIDNLKELRRTVRDLDVNEEELKIRLVQANLAEQQTRGLDANSLTRRESVIKAVEAQRAIEDFYADAPEKRRKLAEFERYGIEGSPGVKAAKQSLDDAQYAAGRAAQNLADKQEDYNRTLDASKRANDDAAYAIKQATDRLGEQKSAWEIASAVAHVTGDEVEGVRAKLIELASKRVVTLEVQHAPGAIEAVNAAFDSVGEKMQALKLMASDPTLTMEDAYKKVRLQNQTAFAAPAVSSSRSNAVNNTLARLNPESRAVGGPVTGAGTGTSDSIWATGPMGTAYKLSHNEHVWTADEVSKVGGHGGMYALRRMIRGLATGGPVIDIRPLNLGDAFARSGVLNRFVDSLFGVAATASAGSFTGPAGKGYSINEIIQVARSSGLEVVPTSTLRRGDHGYHGLGQAVDFGSLRGNAGSPGNDALGAWWFASNFRPMLRELIHTSMDGTHGWYVKDGRVVPKGFYGAATEAAHINHVHVAAAPGFSQGITSTATAGGSTFGSLAEFLSYVPTRGAAAPAGSGAERWRATVQQALQQTGYPTTVDYVNAVLRQISTESSGNEKAVQTVHDINWPNNLARGLMQVTPGTFRQYMAPGHADPLSGLDSLLAALRYVRGRYHGDVLGVLGHGHGYDQGGHLKPGGIGWNTARKPERVLTGDQTEAFDRLVDNITGGSGGMRLDDYTIARIAQAVSTRPIPVHVDGRKVADAMIPHLERRVTR